MCTQARFSARYQDRCGPGSRQVLARCRLGAGQEPRGGLRVRPQVASGYKCPRGFGCVPPRSRVVPAINDVKRGTRREGATWTQCHLDRGAGVGVPPSHPHRSTRWGYRSWTGAGQVSRRPCPGQVSASDRIGSGQVPGRCRTGSRPGKVRATFQDKCGHTSFEARKYVPQNVFRLLSKRLFSKCTNAGSTDGVATPEVAIEG